MTCHEDIIKESLEYWANKEYNRPLSAIIESPKVKDEFANLENLLLRAYKSGTTDKIQHLEKRNEVMKKLLAEVKDEAGLRCDRPKYYYKVYEFLKNER